MYIIAKYLVRGLLKKKLESYYIKLIKCVHYL